MGQKSDVKTLTHYKTLILLVLQGGFLNYLLKERMTSRETSPSFFCGAFASFDNTRSGLMESGEVCDHEVSNSLNGTKKKI
jgi:hypothetical protein